LYGYNQQKNFTALKHDFNSADAVGGDRYVFNIKGNTYRLIVLIHFDTRTLYIRFVGKHEDYDKIKNIATI
jgi:mRNA interferase HigB